MVIQSNRAHDGKGSQVLEDVKGIFALSNALRGEPLLISQLVRIAIFAVGVDTAVRLMPHGSWNDAELESLQSAVQTTRFKDEMARAYCGVQAIELTALNDLPLGALRQTNSREMLRIFDQSISSFTGTWPEILARQSSDEDSAFREVWRLFPRQSAGLFATAAGGRAVIGL